MHKLGKLSPRLDPRTLRLETYLAPHLPAIPATMDWGRKLPVTGWGMMDNDQIGDCTCAAAGHLIMNWTDNVGRLITPADGDIVAAYSAITGYTPTDPNTDQGAVELDVLKFWQTKGIAGHKIMAYVSIDPKRLDHLRAAIYLFGGIYTGVQITQAAMNDFDAGKPWAQTTGNIEGGHAVPVVAFDQNGMKCVTWGKEQPLTWAWWQTYADEAWAIVTHDWVAASGHTPSGFNLAQLQTDLAAVKS